MKRLFYFVCVALAAITMTSCQGPQGPRGYDGRDGLVNFKIIDLDIAQKEWGYTNPTDDPRYQYNNNYYYADFDIPELTSNIYDNGVVKVYREFDSDTKYAMQQELPYVRSVEEYNETTQGYDIFYTETVDYIFGPGKITIMYRASDFLYEDNPGIVPVGMHFRVVLMW